MRILNQSCAHCSLCHPLRGIERRLTWESEENHTKTNRRTRGSNVVLSQNGPSSELPLFLGLDSHLSGHHPSGPSGSPVGFLHPSGSTNPSGPLWTFPRDQEPPRRDGAGPSWAGWGSEGGGNGVKGQRVEGESFDRKVAKTPFLKTVFGLHQCQVLQDFLLVANISKMLLLLS